VRALLDQRDEAIVIFGTRGDPLHVNWAAEQTLAPPPFPEGGAIRAHLIARGGEAVPLRVDEKLLGEMIIVRRPAGRTWAEQERAAIRETLEETRGRLADAARRLGISRTTLWRRLRSHPGPAGASLRRSA